MLALREHLVELAHTASKQVAAKQMPSVDHHADISHAEPSQPHDDEPEDDAYFIGLISRLARAQFDTLRLLLLKVAALVDQSTRRVHVRLGQSFGYAPVFARVAAKLRRPPPD